MLLSNQKQGFKREKEKETSQVIKIESLKLMNKERNNNIYLFNKYDNLEGKTIVFRCVDSLGATFRKQDILKKAINSLKAKSSFSISDEGSSIIVIDKLTLLNNLNKLYEIIPEVKNRNIIVYEYYKNFAYVSNKSILNSIQTIDNNESNQFKPIHIVEIDFFEEELNKYYEKSLAYHMEKGLSDILIMKNGIHIENEEENIISLYYEGKFNKAKFNYTVIDSKYKDNKKFQSERKADETQNIYDDICDKKEKSVTKENKKQISYEYNHKHYPSKYVRYCNLCNVHFGSYKDHITSKPHISYLNKENEENLTFTNLSYLFKEFRKEYGRQLYGIQDSNCVDKITIQEDDSNGNLDFNSKSNNDNNVNNDNDNEHLGIKRKLFSSQNEKEEREDSKDNDENKNIKEVYKDTYNEDKKFYIDLYDCEYNGRIVSKGNNHLNEEENIKIVLDTNDITNMSSYNITKEINNEHKSISIENNISLSLFIKLEKADVRYVI